MLFNVYIWKNPRLRKRVLGTLRVLAYGLVVSGGLGALTIRNAVANAEEQSLTLGRKLEGLGDLLEKGNEFRLNGQKVFFATANTDDPVKTVLDRFEAHCNSSTAFDPIEWKSLAALDKSGANPMHDVSRLGVVRKEDAAQGDGMVLCFTSDHGPKDLYKALQTFGETGDLHDLGDVRYAHVSSKLWNDTHNHTTKMRTMVQTLWTDGSFNLKALIGEEGKDAAGSDFVSLPRPLSSTRRFTAEALGTPYAARVYESTASPAQVIEDYNQKMLSADWIAIQNPIVDMPAGKDGRWYSKLETGEQAIISVDESKGKTMVAVGSMGVLDKAPARLQ